MTHDEAVAHVRDHIVGITSREASVLIEMEPPAFFGAVLIIMCAIEYTGALYCGSRSADPREIVTRSKAVRFIHEVIAKASANNEYRSYAKHLYEMYRTGLVHLGEPRAIETTGQASSRYLNWAISREAKHPGYRAGVGFFVHDHLALGQVERGTDTMYLPVSMRQLLKDFCAGCELFVKLLTDEQLKGASDLLTRWRQSADVLARPMKTSLSW